MEAVDNATSTTIQIVPETQDQLEDAWEFGASFQVQRGCIHGRHFLHNKNKPMKSAMQSFIHGEYFVNTENNH